MNILEKELNLTTLFGHPLVEGKIITDNMSEIYQEIVTRREEIYPGCMDVENDEDFDYISKDWMSYHDYVCMEVFPKLKFLFPYIIESLEMVGNTWPIEHYYFKSWINIWPQKQSINPHVHYGEWHGYYVIKDTDTETFYAPTTEMKEIVSFKNFDGHYIFMPAHIPHWAQKNPSKELRISMGFNISSWYELKREERDNLHGRGSKIKDVVLPLKDFL